MDGAGTIILVLILAIIAILVLSFWMNSSARREVETQVTLSPQHSAEIVENSFSSFIWRDVDGPGEINKRRRSMNDTGVTMSFLFEELPAGGTEVKIWMSAWTKRGPSIIGSDTVMRVRSKIIKRLEAQV